MDFAPRFCDALAVRYTEISKTLPVYTCYAVDTQSSNILNQLTPWSKFHLQKLRISHLFKKFLAFYGTQISLPRSQEPVTSHCGLPEESSSQHPALKHLQSLFFDQCEKPNFIPIRRGTIRILYTVELGYNVMIGTEYFVSV